MYGVITPCRRCNSLLVGALIVFTAGCSGSPERSPTRPAIHTSSLPATAPPEVSRDTGSDDGQWIMPARNFASTRYSGLSQITAANVGRLQLAWTFSTGALRGR